MIPESVNITGPDILSLIPQRPPMVMVDEFGGIAPDGRSWTALTVREDNVFYAGGSLAAPGIVEHIAQSAAARAGFLHMRENRPVPEGFIASVEKMKFSLNLPKDGDRLETSVEVLADIFNMSLVHAVCRNGSETVAEGNMKIYLNEEAQEK